jgi:fimbrial chaperone protein
MRACTFAVFAPVCLISFSTPLRAASLQVAPVSIEVPAPAAAAIIKLRNEGKSPLNAQIRVFRWVQKNGQDRLEATDNLVASPPIATLAPNADYTVRLVRVRKQPVSSGESYRLLVDELPDPATRRNRVVTFLVRYSIPVFFYPSDAAEAKITWSVERQHGRIYVSAKNFGDRHVRVSALKLRDGHGTTMSFGAGLAGYALGHSEMRWTAPADARQFTIDNSVVISAQGDSGSINATTSVQPAR